MGIGWIDGISIKIVFFKNLEDIRYLKSVMEDFYEYGNSYIKILLLDYLRKF